MVCWLQLRLVGLSPRFRFFFLPGVARTGPLSAFCLFFFIFYFPFGSCHVCIIFPDMVLQLPAQLSCGAWLADPVNFWAVDERCGGLRDFNLQHSMCIRTFGCRSRGCIHPSKKTVFFIYMFVTTAGECTYDLLHLFMKSLGSAFSRNKYGNASFFCYIRSIEKQQLYVRNVEYTEKGKIERKNKIPLFSKYCNVFCIC